MKGFKCYVKDCPLPFVGQEELLNGLEMTLAKLYFMNSSDRSVRGPEMAMSLDREIN